MFRERQECVRKEGGLRLKKNSDAKDGGKGGTPAQVRGRGRIAAEERTAPTTGS